LALRKRKLEALGNRRQISLCLGELRQARRYLLRQLA
jgi:hypothetical protein